jgi:hypothetical protein
MQKSDEKPLKSIVLSHFPQRLAVALSQSWTILI